MTAAAAAATVAHPPPQEPPLALHLSPSDFSGESNKLNDLNQAVVDRVSGSEDKLAS